MTAQLIICAGLASTLSACGGGGSSTPANALDDGNNSQVSEGPDQGNTGTADAPDTTGSSDTTETSGTIETTEAPPGDATIVLLPTPSSAYTQFSDLQVDAAGVQHVVMTDTELRVYYLSCISRCDESENWRSLLLQDFSDAETGYAIGKLRIDRDGGIHVAVMAAASTFASALTRYYRCKDGCTENENWGAVTARVHDASFLPFRVADSDWFALSANGLPRFVTLETLRGVETNGSLIYATCQRLPCDVNDWISIRLTTLPRTFSRPAELVIDRNGAASIAVLSQQIDSDDVQVLYLHCDDNCDGATPDFSSPVVVDAYQSRDNEQERMRLSLGPDDRPHITLLDYEPGADKLVHHACISNCSSRSGNWDESNPLRGNEITGLASSFGRGLDVATVDGELRIYLTGAGENDRVATALLGYACSGNCDDRSTWRLIPAGTTKGAQLPDQGGCVYVGSEIAPPISASGPSVSFTLQPTYYCNFVPADVTLPDASDIFTFPRAAVWRLR